MTVNIKVPTLGESVTEATVGKWFKAAGDAVTADEPLLELETDKVTLEVPAPASGKLAQILVEAGVTVEVDAVLGAIAEGADGAAAAAAPAPPAPAPDPTPGPAAGGNGEAAAALSPAIRKLVAENKLDPAAISGSGRGGRLVKQDVLKFLGKRGAPAAEAKPAEAPAPAAAPAAPQAAPQMPPQVARAPAAPAALGPREERVPMTRLRRRIAERLKEAQETAAILTTFNEVDMGAVMELRAMYRDEYEKRHGVRLGFMSFFVKASIVALREIPEVNAEIDGEDIVYKNHYDIGVAVSTPQGLVVPVLRDADAMGFGDIEKSIGDMARRARDGRLELAEMQGGTFTITNGGVFGSLLSTPILNPPQSGILGMHKIEKRAVVVGEEIVARPMMYLALSYDHRIVDGRQAVTFLVRVKECLEEPQRMLLDV